MWWPDLERRKREKVSEYGRSVRKYEEWRVKRRKKLEGNSVFTQPVVWCRRTSSRCGRTKRKNDFRMCLVQAHHEDVRAHHEDVRAHQTLLFFSKISGGSGAGSPEVFFEIFFKKGAGAH